MDSMLNGLRAMGNNKERKFIQVDLVSYDWEGFVIWSQHIADEMSFDAITGLCKSINDIVNNSNIDCCDLEYYDTFVPTKEEYKMRVTVFNRTSDVYDEWLETRNAPYLLTESIRDGVDYVPDYWSYYLDHEEEKISPEDYISMRRSGNI